ncbi:hypothetical protein TNCT_254081 [Trichonephila clavata]|uniref:Uncharacterized protein n=1 Tax=Trichonephila clavata TaxID=2740835 RepID=A0A8X6GC68_TRICU|nr:hypothetical protein TNCT_254081 [Trichonephila clavata]
MNEENPFFNRMAFDSNRSFDEHYANGTKHCWRCGLSGVAYRSLCDELIIYTWIEFTEAFHLIHCWANGPTSVSILPPETNEG